MAQRISELESQVTSQLMEIKETRSSLEENTRMLSRKEEQLMVAFSPYLLFLLFQGNVIASILFFTDDTSI